MASRDMVRLMVADVAKLRGYDVSEDEIDKMTDAMMKNPDVESILKTLEEKKKAILEGRE